MDVAYDHIQEDSFVSTNEDSGSGAQANNSESSSGSGQRQNFDLNAEFQETLRAFSSNPWGARLGGLWGNVRRQGENYYQEARQEYNAASEEAIKGFNDLRESIVDRTRGLSIAGLGTANEDENKEKDGDATATPPSPTTDSSSTAKAAGDDAEGEGFIARFRAEAAKRLKDIERAEDAADEALLKFGTNVRNFLRDAVTIAPPDEEQSNKVLFESKDIDGKRVIHTTRFEAQLHAIHSNLERLSQDPVSDEWPKWKSEFNVDNKTNEIATDLEMYSELRRAMETLVPEKVEYADFWCRYYFLRLVIETEEKKRKELLKASADDDEEEVAWDEDSDSDDGATSTPQMGKDSSKGNLAPPTASGIKPSEPRRSNDQQSQPDSDASYDLVSGTTSRSPGSPKEKEKTPTTAGGAASKTDESDEEDWE